MMDTIVKNYAISSLNFKVNLSLPLTCGKGLFQIMIHMVLIYVKYFVSPTILNNKLIPDINNTKLRIINRISHIQKLMSQNEYKLQCFILI